MYSSSSRLPKKKIYDVYEPEDLERGFYTDYDKFLRDTDQPERFADRTVAVEDCDCMNEDAFTELSQYKKLDAIERELEREARWILENAYSEHLTDQTFDHPVLEIEKEKEPEEDDDENRPRRKYNEKKEMVKCYTWPEKEIVPDTDDQFIYQLEWFEKKLSDDPAERDLYAKEYGRRYNTFLYKIFKCLYNIRFHK